jgi:hypothetical protein
MAGHIGEFKKAGGPNTCEYIATSQDRGDFLIQVAWPLSWSEDGVAPPNDPEPQTLFVMHSINNARHELIPA